MEVMVMGDYLNTAVSCVGKRMGALKALSLSTAITRHFGYIKKNGM